MSAHSPPLRAHLIACRYDDEEESKLAFHELSKRSCRNSGVMRVRSARGSLVVVCADDLAAAEYCSRLPFGAGRPVRLDEESATGLARRRREGAQEAEQAPGKFYRQDGITDPIARPHGVEPVVQLPAVNTEHRPWASPGGIAGARCPSFADAAHVREVIVSEHLHQMEGMVVVFGDAQAAVVAVVADTPETSQLAHESLLRLAGNLSYEPSPEEAWALWATRLQAGSAPFPISVDGTAKEAMAFLTGSSLPPGAKLHPPSRNQLCPCGSGRKHTHCCGQ